MNNNNDIVTESDFLEKLVAEERDPSKVRLSEIMCCGLWAEFRLDRFGAILTLLSVVSPFKIIALGAVAIAGNTTQDRMGRTAVAGPVTNVALALLLLALAKIAGRGGLSVAMLAGPAINAFIALFNLIPFRVFDGLKVFRWNKMIWLVLFVLAALTTALSYLQIY